MPWKPPHICRCGKIVKDGDRCGCGAAAKRDRDRRADAKRGTSSQRGYTGAWDKAKAGYLAKHPFCVFCGCDTRDTPEGGLPLGVVDHKRRHGGDKAVFWDRNNWQTLCRPCHNSTKQREERRKG